MVLSKPLIISMLTVVTCVTALGGTAGATENSTLTLNFGGSPGATVPHSYDYGVPEDAGESYTMRVPVIYKELAGVFHDMEVTVKSADKIVQSISAVRAYKSLNDCNKGLAIVKDRLMKGLPKDYTGADAGWQYQSADGAVAGRAVCEKRRRRPFFTINLAITLL